MDRLDAMTVFAKAVEKGSLSAAGRELEMPLATVSRKISDLENHLKARLLIRSTRQLALTDAGHAYLGACKRLLEDLAEAERTASGEYQEPKGGLIITAPIVFGRLHLLPVAAEFLRAYPAVDVRIVMTDNNLNLVEEHVDAAVRVGELPDSNLIATRLGQIRQVVCASPDYLKARGAPKKPEDLARHDCISFAGLMSTDSWIFRHAAGEVRVPVHSRMVLNTGDGVVDAAAASVGLGRVFSYHADRALEEGRLKLVLRKYEPAPFPVSLLYPGPRRVPLKLRAFLDFATPRLRDRLARSPTA